MLHSTRRCNPPASPTNPHQGIRSTVLTDQKTHHHVPPPWASALTFNLRTLGPPPTQAASRLAQASPPIRVCAPLSRYLRLDATASSTTLRQGTRRTPKRLFGCLTVCTSVTSAGGLALHWPTQPPSVCPHRTSPYPFSNARKLHTATSSTDRPVPSPACACACGPLHHSTVPVLGTSRQTLVNTVCQSASLPACPACQPPLAPSSLLAAPVLLASPVPRSPSRPLSPDRASTPATSDQRLGNTTDPPVRLLCASSSSFRASGPDPDCGPFSRPRTLPVLPRLGHLPPSSLRDPSRAVTFPGPPLLGFGSCS